jgi:hypothetical protein
MDNPENEYPALIADSVGDPEIARLLTLLARAEKIQTNQPYWYLLVGKRTTHTD